MITFTNVTLIYPNSERTILEGLSLQVQEGEMVLVIGHTGVGKSSFIKLINGLVPHHTGGILSGEITINGRSTREVKPGELADIVGIVGQNPLSGFVADIVEEEIAFGMETLGVPPDVMRKRVEEILDLLGLTELRRREITTLSGGEQQRLAIGAALVTNPKILVLDEPTSALDPVAAEEVLSILHRLVHDLGLTVILAEHRLERVIQFVDRVLLISEDGSVDIGAPTEILARSPIAPPIIEIARELQLPKVALTVRELRRTTQDLRKKFNASPDRATQVRKLGGELLAMKGVTAKYDRDFSLNNVSFSLRRGEIVALMGRNGAGKSTLLKSAVGQAPVISGSVHLGGFDPRTLEGKALIQLAGYVPQEPSDLLYSQSVKAECEMADRDNGVSAGSTWKIYKNLMEIPSEKTHPRDLSEGQKLGLALSIILSADPQLIILDEPTRGVDYRAKSKLVAHLKLLAHNQENPRGVLIATHDVELVAEVADRVIFLADGEIIADGPTRQVLTGSPAFAPQVSKVFAPKTWLTIGEVINAYHQQLQ